MATQAAARPHFGKTSISSRIANRNLTHQFRFPAKRWLFLAGLLVFATIAVAQSAPQITGVDPGSGKVNDTVTVTGTDLGKANVSAVYLSDDKNDYKAAILEQSDTKITVKVPQVKAGGYNISLQVGDKLFIKPVKFKVEE